MNSSHIDGAANSAEGVLKSAGGDFLGDTQLQAEGFIEQAKGEAQSAYGTAKDMFSAAVDATPERAREFADRAVSVAKANPVLSAVVAGAVGYFFAMALRHDDKGIKLPSKRAL